MNIQIFGKNKCFETKKAQRYFKERGIKFQFIDLTEKGMSKGEYNSVSQAVGGFDNIVDKSREEYFTIQYLLPEARVEKLLENPKLLLTPIVRNGKQATIGFQPDVWKKWE